MKQSPERDVHLDHFLQLLVVVLVLWPLKRVGTHQHDVYHDATRPYVSNLHAPIKLHDSRALLSLERWSH